MRTATTALASLLAAAMLAAGAMGAAAQAPLDDGGPVRLEIDITVTSADGGTQVAVRDARVGVTQLVPLTPAVMAQLDALAIEYPYLAVNEGVPLGRDFGRLTDFAGRFPYMAAEQ